MSEIRIITASAGSGKTTRLTEILRDVLIGGAVRPDAVVATTFTNKAAAELQERARQALLAAGRPADAHRLGAARIGTVNSVCGRLVEEFAFELGLPPEIRVIDDVVAAETLNAALSTVVPQEIEHELADLKSRVEDFEWQDAVRKIVESARTNGISLEALEDCASRSVETLFELLGEPFEDGAVFDHRLAVALEEFLRQYEAQEGDTTKTTAKAADRCRRALATLRRGASLPWREWASLAFLAVGQKSRELVVGVHQAAAAHDRHPTLRGDLKRAIRLSFRLARRGLEIYQEQKRSWGVVDFVDQEVYALDLLGREEIRDRLCGEIELVLIDEFQDTSPLQLAIFLKLARIAPLSIWVGDQKQAIFGFRGTDPALMKAAIEDLLAGSDPHLTDTAVERILESGRLETLTHSWRSRPELVRLTSDLFARAFAAHGIPEDRVRLEPGSETEPEGLGPIVEHWPLRLANQRKTTELATAVAVGVRRLLRDESQRVRDPLAGGTRRVAPGDVAVLCRTNKQCSLVAVALEAVGIRAEVPRVGLLATPEGRAVLAGLTLWLDPRCRLAAAELARMAEFPDREDEWLERLLRVEGDRSFEELPVVRDLREARDVAWNAGPLEALDRVIVATGLRTLARRWGKAATRVANVDALRAHAVRYVDVMEARNLPATVPGLLRHLRGLEKFGYIHNRHVERQDQQAVRSAGDAVIVSTWHRAKGLEWPVTVLFGLERLKLKDALGVQIAANWDAFDLDRPLEGRWVRFWLSPYRGPQKGTPFGERLRDHKENLRSVEQDRREQLRLLYVGWTRARDRLVLAAHEGKLLNGLLGQLRATDPSLICAPPINGQPVTWAGRLIDVAVRPATPEQPEPRSVEPGCMVLPAGPAAHPPAFLSPSGIATEGRTGEPEVLGPGLRLSGSFAMDRVGSAVHGFLAADDPALPADFRVESAAGLLRRWGVEGALDPEGLMRASEAFLAWCGRRWPHLQRAAELPLYHCTEEGTVVHGIADVVLEGNDGNVLIDHKAYPGTLEAGVRHAASFGGQLRAYGAALEASKGRPVLATYIHLPLIGCLVPVFWTDYGGAACGS